MAKPTVERLRELLSYDPETGILRWRVSRSRSLPGDIAGTLHYEGYIRILVDYTKYQAHHVAWAMHYGEWPSGMLDHINRNRADNRIANLRPATRKQNAYNQLPSKRNKLGLKGVSMRESGRFCATIGINGRRRSLGTYSTKEEAARAYNEAALRAFGEFAHVNMF